MPYPSLLSKDDALLLIIDVQEAYRDILPDRADLVRNIQVLIRACAHLNVPVFLTEQYPKGLGKTLAEIKTVLADHSYFEKKAFSCCGAEGFLVALAKTGRRQIMVSGIEAHVCVNQTVHDLLQAGYSPHLVSDAISSRSPRNKDIGIQKMIASGAIISSVEMALFEILQESGTPLFKTVQQLVK